MKQVKMMFGVLATFGLVAACDSGGGEYVKKQEEFATKVCECKDMDCVQKVQQEQADWATKNASTATSTNEKDAEKMAESAKKMADCIQKVAGGGAGE
jgi:hypothetical protein